MRTKWGSRFEALGETHGESVTDGLNKEREDDVRMEIPIIKERFNGTDKGKIPNHSAANFRNGLKPKGKRISIGLRPKKKSNILRPANRALERNPLVFNDGSVMGHRDGSMNGNSFSFEAVQITGNLDSNWNIAAKQTQKK